MQYFQRFIELIGWVAALSAILVIFVVFVVPSETEDIGPLTNLAVFAYLLYSGWYICSRFVSLVMGKPVNPPFGKAKPISAQAEKSTSTNRLVSKRAPQTNSTIMGRSVEQSSSGAEAPVREGVDDSSQPLVENSLFNQPQPPQSASRDDADLRARVTLKTPDYKPKLLGSESFGIANTTIKRPKSSQKPRFIMPDKVTEVVGASVTGPVYVGRAASGNRGVIDSSLPVKMNSNSVDALPYWPDYTQISPQQRGKYLAWLTEGRGFIDETGYAFLYFYGFERYAIVDAEKDDPDTRRERLLAIISECERLSGLLENRSFSMYSADFVDYLIIRYLPDLIDQRLQKPSAGNCNVARYAISKFVDENPKVPLPGKLAIHWFFINKKLRPKDFAERSFKDFADFFINNYERGQGGSVVVKKNAKKLEIAYNVAGASYGSSYPRVLTIPTQLPSPFELKGPNQALNIILTFTKTRYKVLQKAKEDGPLSHLATLSDAQPVPEELQHIKRKLDLLVPTGGEEQPHAGAVVSRSALGELFNTDCSVRLSAAQGRTLASALERLGYCLVPDPEHKNPVPGADDDYLIFKGSRVRELSASGRMVYVGIRLGYMVAAADGIDDEEESIISKLPETLPNLDEKRFMVAFARWVQSSGATSKAGLKDQIEQLSKTYRKGLFTVLEEVALADGQLSRKEVTQLSRMHESLGLGEFKLEDYAKLAEAPAPVKGKAKQKTKAIVEPDKSAKLVLNAEKLAEIAASTQGAHELLGEIFNEDDSDIDEGAKSAAGAEQKGSTTDDAISETWHHGSLNAIQEQIFDELIQQEEWAMSAVESLIKGYGQMVAGTIEAINDAAIDRYGEPVLEEADGSLIVYGDMVESAW
ncbi:MAG: TerB N-terminal domain-containing protein [Saccharospirillum sp.]|nr:TerB N-terminal domain-containing protein [Saccharospirillum sp.]